MLLDIIDKDDNWTIYYNPNGESNALLLTLYFMHDQGKISDEEYEAAKAYTDKRLYQSGHRSDYIRFIFILCGLCCRKSA